MKYLLAEAKEEHVQGENMLQELAKMDDTTIEWTGKVTVLKENTEHHLREEEEEMFVQAKKILKDGEAEKMAIAFIEGKKELLAKIAK